MAQGFSAVLFTNQAAAGNGAAQLWGGGRGIFTAAGTFGGTSVTLEYLGPNNTTWLPVRAMDPAGVQTTVALADSGMIGFELPPGSIRAVATGGTPTALFARADRVIY
jgi:hypothetical protein